ncbi:FAA hydrolase family protein [Mesorhizobium atlanticum]|uniref:FAA hydrolase family protein n=2 Tax=Mesorhizobium atlanticum TaxID=2233532 RepID=A0A330H713_9HYPH|nr:FAA hydrolase family protein [Mesorhizobium atlanticum]
MTIESPTKNKEASVEDLFVFPPASTVVLPVTGTSRLFPVRRLFCVGRNYAEHAREMGHDPVREPPFFFMKTADAVLAPGESFSYPEMSKDVHHEVELVVAMKSGGANLPIDTARQHVFGYAVGLDMTRRDLQAEAKRLQRPWEIGKSFEGSAPVGPLTRIEDVATTVDSGAITLDINGHRRQAGDLEDMIWSAYEIIAHVSLYFEVRPGDLIFTGTPAGVGPVRISDRIVAKIDGLEPLTLDVVARASGR